MATRAKASKIVGTGRVVAKITPDGRVVALEGAPNHSDDPEVWIAWAMNRAQYEARMVASIHAVWALGEALTAMKNSGRFVTDAWERMFDDNKNPYKLHFPFGRVTGGRFMLIASNEILSRRAHSARLPAAWSTLYALTTIPPARLERAFERGLITPDMERKDVKLLMPPKHEEPQTQEDAFRTILTGFEKAVDGAREYLLKMRPFWKKLTDGEVDHLRLLASKLGETIRTLESQHTAKKAS